MDTISRQDAIDAIMADKIEGNTLSIMVALGEGKQAETLNETCDRHAQLLNELPSAQPTLYGYKIDHLAYIARVMEKEGVTADYAVRTFDDIRSALRMIIEEVQERVMETLNERYDL